MAHTREYVFTYADLAEATGLTKNAISQHVVRGHLDPEDLQSVAVYLARYASESLKERMFKALMRRDMPDDPGGWKKKRGGK